MDIRIKEDSVWAAVPFMLAPRDTFYLLRVSLGSVINAHKDYKQRKSQVLSSFMVHQFLSIILCVLFKYKLEIIRKFSSHLYIRGGKTSHQFVIIKEIDQMIYEVIKKGRKVDPPLVRKEENTLNLSRQLK